MNDIINPSEWLDGIILALPTQAQCPSPLRVWFKSLSPCRLGD